MDYKTDIEIAQENQMLPIFQVAEAAGTLSIIWSPTAATKPKWT